MKRFGSTRLTVAVLLGVVGILAISAVAIASNMGFKLNKAITPVPANSACTGPATPFGCCTGAGTGTCPGFIGLNFTSLPYRGPYTNTGVLCSQTGLVSTGGAAIRGKVTTRDANAGTTFTYTCGAAGPVALIPGKGVQIAQPITAGAPSSIILVGSHDPTLSITVPQVPSNANCTGLGTPFGCCTGAMDGTCPGFIGLFWFSVPYHTTAATSNDLCAQVGLVSTGGAALRGKITQRNATAGTTFTYTCGAAAPPALVLGQMVQLATPNLDKTFTPAHF